MFLKRRLISATLIGACIVGVFSAAQDAGPPSGTPEPLEVNSIDAAVPSTAPTPEIIETPPAPDLPQQVDNVFKEAVNATATVLFYRLGKSERRFIVFERKSIFQRRRGASGDFRNVKPNDPGQPRSLTESQVEVLAARGKLVDGHTINGVHQYYRWGLMDAEPVEYVTVKLDSQVQLESGAELATYGRRFAYRPDQNEYRIIERKRNVLGQEVIGQPQVDQWQELRYLKQNASHAPGEPPYLMTESVGGIPVVVAWLASGAVFFTLFMSGFNFWGFKHALDIVRGKYDNPEETGEVTHFQALASALSATVGLGNIAGVTIAMTMGGPGAYFWMLVCGFLGMCTKFTECTLGQKYRDVRPDGTILGGPMRYLKAGLTEIHLGWLGSILAFVFTVMCILASFGGGNMYQANQSGSAMLQTFQQNNLEKLSTLNTAIKAAADAENVAEMKQLQQQKADLQTELTKFEKNFKIVFGVVLAALVASVILGGIKRIGAAAGMIVPTMCIAYALACLYIIGCHIERVPSLIASIFTEAFNGKAMGGGIMGVLVVGVQRAAFSNEAGAGSAAIAHSAAKTEEPIREGCVALLEPFIDTIIVCSMTALVILITGAWDNNEWVVEQGLEGAALTSRAFKEELWFFPIILSIATVLFAFSTIISWSYYGEKSWEILFGSRSTVLYKILTVVCVFIGTIVNLGSVLDFSDMMILGMAFPNILGVVLLSPLVRRDLMDYWRRYKAGEFKIYH